MDYYCNVCDKSIKIKSESEHFQSKAHSKVEECLQMKHTFENPEFFIIDELFNSFTTIKIFFIPVKNVFYLVFDAESMSQALSANKENNPHNESEIRIKQSKFHLENFE